MSVISKSDFLRKVSWMMNWMQFRMMGTIAITVNTFKLSCDPKLGDKHLQWHGKIAYKSNDRLQDELDESENELHLDDIKSPLWLSNTIKPFAQTISNSLSRPQSFLLLSLSAWNSFRSLISNVKLSCLGFAILEESVEHFQEIVAQGSPERDVHYETHEVNAALVCCSAS